ncbi:hypothetical protein NPIL_181101 [Nephila pilipes]|uniref:Uncharacterized protein n=1 Tax=Nephila pilipes TaxID=299642 RepID=A0A8X6UMB3_NEPPI|nr:hypothetical protein NPIL_181101 [Nephila pilipes]
MNRKRRKGFKGHNNHGQGGRNARGFNRLRRKQPGEKLQKAEYDLSQMDQIKKDFYNEHPNVSDQNEHPSW